MTRMKNFLSLQANQLAVLIQVEEDEKNGDISFSVMPVESDVLDVSDPTKHFLRDLVRAMCAVSSMPEDQIMAMVAAYFELFQDFSDEFDDENIIPFPTKH